MKKVTLDGAMMRNKLRGRLAKEVAEMSLSTEERRKDSRKTLDELILRARKINLTIAKGEEL